MAPISIPIGPCRGSKRPMSTTTWDHYWGRSFFPMSAASRRYSSRSSSRDQSRARRWAQSCDLEKETHASAASRRSFDGEIRHVEDFLVDDANWNIRYVAVDTRNWWPGKKVLISPRSVRAIDWAHRLMTLDVGPQKVKGSPPFDLAKTVDRAYEEQFHGYYGWPGGLA